MTMISRKKTKQKNNLNRILDIWDLLSFTYSRHNTNLESFDYSWLATNLQNNTSNNTTFVSLSYVSFCFSA